MQIMIYLDSMLFSLSIQQQYPLLLILALILPTLDPFIHHPQIPAEVLPRHLALTIIGTAHQYLVICQHRTLFLPWIFIIIIGSTIHLHSLQLAAESVVLISLLFRLLARGHLGPVLTYQGRDRLCIHSLLVTGTLNRFNSILTVLSLFVLYDL